MWLALVLVLAGPSLGALSPVLCQLPNATDPMGSIRPYPWDRVPRVFSEQQGARYTIPVSGHYCQCNSSWARDWMTSAPGHKNPSDTVCWQGCAMSAVSTFLNAQGVLVDGAEATPGTVNKWLHNNNGYICDPDCDDLNLPVFVKLDPRISLFGYERSFTLDNIISWLKRGWAAVLHVENNRHFVLTTGYFVDAHGKPNGTLITRDSAFPRQVISVVSFQT